MNEIFEPWSEFNVALAGAAAALVGLVIVAASVNIRDIIGSRTLTTRIGAAVAVLLLALLVSALGLIPGITAAWFGGILLAATAGVALFQVTATRLITAEPTPGHAARWAKSTLGFLPIVGYLIGGALALEGSTASLYVVAAGTLLAIVSAISVSWVALVEVLR